MSPRTSPRSSPDAQQTRDTIFALASGRPPAAIAVIRISGPRAHAAAQQIAGALPDPRQASLRQLRDQDGQLLDEALLLRFDGPASATGEDVVEFHCHGSRAVVDAMVASLSEIKGLRLAEPGEFTRRAFENGRIDLTEAEGLADLLEAETESQRRAALAMAEGGLRHQVEAWQARLLTLSARAEAAIDYDEEDGLGADPALARECGELASEIGQWTARPTVEPLRDGVRVVLAGPTNAGKSSLINALAGSEKAIVTEIAGTTRDQIEVPLAIDGVPCILVDTAGLRETAERVERIGIERAYSAIDRADVLLWLGDPAEAPDHQRIIMVHSRVDQPDRASVPAGSMAVSSVTGAGLDPLLAAIAAEAPTLLPTEGSVAINRRQASALAEAAEALRLAESTSDIVIAAEGLRSARSAFDRVTGRAGVEDLLDTLFGRFCLGK
jgi:tRNA modification GTPase